MNRPLLKRSPWHYAEYEDFVEGTNTSTLPPLSFESLRPAVVEEAKKLYAESVTQKDPCRAVELLNRLVFDKRMDSVWAELYKKTRDDDYKATDEFVNPIYVTQASIAASLRKRASDLAERGEDLLIRP